MESKYKREYVNCVFPKKPQSQYAVIDLAIKVDEFMAFCKKHKEHIDAKKGWLGLDVYKAKARPDDTEERYYTQFYYKEESAVKAVDHLPDRVAPAAVKETEDDLPF